MSRCSTLQLRQAKSRPNRLCLPCFYRAYRLIAKLQFYLISFWIDDPGKLSVLGIVDLLENVAAFFAQDFDQAVEILHPVIDHEGCSAGRKLVALRRTNGPDGCSGNRLAFTVGPSKRCANPFLDIDSEMLFVPSL